MNDIVDRLKRVARGVRGTERDQDLSGMALEALAQHIERVRCGEAPLAEFCTTYRLPMPERRYFNVAPGAAVVEHLFIGGEEVSVQPEIDISGWTRPRAEVANQVDETQITAAIEAFKRQEHLGLEAAMRAALEAGR